MSEVRRKYTKKEPLLDFTTFFNEEIAAYDQIQDKDLLYKTYVDAYEKVNIEKGMDPWERSHYDHTARKWAFAGTLPHDGTPEETLGMVAFREKNGILKLVGTQGKNPHAKIKGLLEVIRTGKPIWGAMDQDFVIRLQKLGFVTPTANIMRMMLPKLQNDPMFSSGGSWDEIDDDGAVNFNHSVMGNLKKYFTGNKSFFKLLMGKMMPQSGLESQIQQWNAVPEGMKAMAFNMVKSKLPPQLQGLTPNDLNWIAALYDDHALPKPGPNTTHATPVKTMEPVDNHQTNAMS